VARPRPEAIRLAAWILAHSSWPQPATRDPSNRGSGKPEAIALGEGLFFSPRLSGSAGVLCASCHEPWRGFTDRRPRALGLATVDRNTPSVVNVRLQRWFGWDGANDTLWAQSIRPLLDPREMASSPGRIAALVRDDPELRGAFAAAFGAPPADDNTVLASVGKALAAYQETLESGRTPFDELRDALARRSGGRSALSGAGAARPADLHRQLRVLSCRSELHRWRVPRRRYRVTATGRHLGRGPAGRHPQAPREPLQPARALRRRPLARGGRGHARGLEGEERCGGVSHARPARCGAHRAVHARREPHHAVRRGGAPPAKASGRGARADEPVRGRAERPRRVPPNPDRARATVRGRADGRVPLSRGGNPIGRGPQRSFE